MAQARRSSVSDTTARGVRAETRTVNRVDIQVANIRNEISAQLARFETQLGRHTDSFDAQINALQQALLEKFAAHGSDFSPGAMSLSQRGPSLKIEPFAGDAGLDFRTWLENDFELKFRANNWPEASKPRILAGFLTGHALFLYKALPEETKDSYADLVNEVAEKLLTVERKQFLAQQYESRMQQPTETVSEYARKLSDLAQSALSYMSNQNERQINLRDKFIGGLRPEIRSHVGLMFSPETFQKALQAAERVEKMNQELQSAATSKLEASLETFSKRLDKFEQVQTPAGLASIATAPPASNQIDWALAAQMANLETRNNPAGRQWAASNQIQTAGPRDNSLMPMLSPQQFTATGRTVCQICNKSGHTATNCRSRNEYCDFHNAYGHSTASCRAKKKAGGTSRPQARNANQQNTYAGSAPSVQYIEGPHNQDAYIAGLQTQPALVPAESTSPQFGQPINSFVGIICGIGEDCANDQDEWFAGQWQVIAGLEQAAEGANHIIEINGAESHVSANECDYRGYFAEPAENVGQPGWTTPYLDQNSGSPDELPRYNPVYSSDCSAASSFTSLTASKPATPLTTENKQPEMECSVGFETEQSDLFDFTQLYGAGDTEADFGSYEAGETPTYPEEWLARESYFDVDSTTDASNRTVTIDAPGENRADTTPDHDEAACISQSREITPTSDSFSASTTNRVYREEIINRESGPEITWVEHLAKEPHKQPNHSTGTSEALDAQQQIATRTEPDEDISVVDTSVQAEKWEPVSAQESGLMAPTLPAEISVTPAGKKGQLTYYKDGTPENDATTLARLRRQRGKQSRLRYNVKWCRQVKPKLTVSAKYGKASGMIHQDGQYTEPKQWFMGMLAPHHSEPRSGSSPPNLAVSADKASTESELQESRLDAATDIAIVDLTTDSGTDQEEPDKEDWITIDEWVEASEKEPATDNEPSGKKDAEAYSKDTESDLNLRPPMVGTNEPEQLNSAEAAVNRGQVGMLARIPPQAKNHHHRRKAIVVNRETQWLSPQFQVDVQVGLHTFTCADHCRYFYTCLEIGDTENARKILTERDAFQQKLLFEDCRKNKAATGNRATDEGGIFFMTNLQKFAQHGDLKQTLLATGDDLLWFTPTESYWITDPPLSRRCWQFDDNSAGKILMEIRSKLRATQSFEPEPELPSINELHYGEYIAKDCSATAEQDEIAELPLVVETPLRIADDIPNIRLRVNGALVSAVVDTGAAISVIQKDWVDALGIPASRLAETEFLAPIGSSPLKLSGETTIRLSIRGHLYTHKFAVANFSGTMKIILGMDFLRLHQGIVDLLHTSLRLAAPTQETSSDTHYPKPRNKRLQPAFHFQRTTQKNWHTVLLGRILLYIAAISALAATTVKCLRDQTALPFPNPMVCQTTTYKQIWSYPTGWPCPTTSRRKAEQETPVRASLQMYRNNILQYNSDAYLCQKVTTKVKAFTYFFNDEHMHDSVTIKEVVDAAECERMKTFKICSAGKLSQTGTIFATTNKLQWSQPGGGINCCKWKVFQVTNCFLIKAKVYKKHGNSFMESPRRRNVPPLHPIPVIAPWFQIACDIMGPLPKSKAGNKSIIVFQDYFTKWVVCVPLPDATANRIARVFVEHVICKFGVPHRLLTDQGANLVGEVMQETCRLLGIKKLQTTAYHPACDGMVERFNRTMEAMLSVYVDNNQDDWDTILPFVAFAYNSSTHESTGATPFFLNFGRDPSLPLDVALRAVVPEWSDVDSYQHELVENLTASWELAGKAIGQAQQNQKRHHDKKCHKVTFMEGDRVYLHVPRVAKGNSLKLARCWRGPFRILSLSDDGTGAVISPCSRSTRSQEKRVSVRRLKHAPQSIGLPPLRTEPSGDEEDSIGVDQDDARLEIADAVEEPITVTQTSYNRPRSKIKPRDRLDL